MNRRLGVFTFVEADEKGVLLDGALSPTIKVLSPGLHILRPHQRMLGVFRYIEPTLAITSKRVMSYDGIPFNVDWTLNHGFDPDRLVATLPAPLVAARIGQLVGGGLRQIVHAQTEEGLRCALSKYDALDLCGDFDREQLRAQIIHRLQRRLGGVGFLFHELLVGEITPQAEYAAVVRNLQIERLRTRAKVLAQKEYSGLGPEEWKMLLTLEQLEILRTHGFPPMFMPNYGAFGWNPSHFMTPLEPPDKSAPR